MAIKQHKNKKQNKKYRPRVKFISQNVYIGIIKSSQLSKN